MIESNPFGLFQEVSKILKISKRIQIKKRRHNLRFRTTLSPGHAAFLTLDHFHHSPMSE